LADSHEGAGRNERRQTKQNAADTAQKGATTLVWAIFGSGGQGFACV
jgi:hypothetical protein